MSPGLIAVFFGLGVGGWAYSKLAHTTGNSNQGNVAITASLIGLAAAVVIFTLFKFVFNW